MSWRLASCDWLESAAVSELSVAPRVCTGVGHACVRACVCVYVCLEGIFDAYFRKKGMKKRSMKS